MLASLLQKIDRPLPRVNKDVWLSFRIDLSAGDGLEAKNDLVIRLATDRDIEQIAAGPECAEPVVSSCLRFWREYGFRSLYLGFVRNDPEPSIFQYVIDERDNHRYRTMLYGNMFRTQPADSVQLENLYSFQTKRRRNLAVDFERQLFRLLRQQGRVRARTHISIRNRPALIWASLVGFRPDHWITMVSIDLPLLRDCRKQFAFTPLRQTERGSYPLSLFKG